MRTEFINVSLYKLKTLDDAEYPQEEKFKSNTLICKGFMPPHVFNNLKTQGSLIIAKDDGDFFRTSQITNIFKETEQCIKFKTLNSIYLLIKEKNKD